MLDINKNARKHVLLIIKVIITAAIVFFLAIYIIKLYYAVRLNTLCLYDPKTYDVLHDVAQKDGIVDKPDIKKYLKFYKKVAVYMPDRADANGLIGFCYYKIGQNEKAIAYYQKAIQLNPNFFWFYHNLGVIFFKNKEYDKAANAFAKAVQTDTNKSLMYIHSSQRIYIPIYKGKIKTFSDMKDQIDRGVADSYYYLSLCLKVMGKEKESIVFFNKSAMQNKIVTGAKSWERTISLEIF